MEQSCRQCLHCIPSQTPVTDFLMPVSSTFYQRFLKQHHPLGSKCLNALGGHFSLKPPHHPWSPFLQILLIGDCLSLLLQRTQPLPYPCHLLGVWAAPAPRCPSLETGGSDMGWRRDIFSTIPVPELTGTQDEARLLLRPCSVSLSISSIHALNWGGG